MKTLRRCIKEAQEKGVAIGHFNTSNLEGLHAIYNAAKNLGVPVIVGLSEGEEKFMGYAEAVALVRAIRERDDYPIFLNADHHKNFDSVKRCIDAGFDSVIFDGAEMSFEENVKVTKECVDYARKVISETGREILVEGELGYIGSGSDIKDKIPEGAGVKTKPEEAKKFVEKTGVDLLAPSVGSIHGLIREGKPHIDGELVNKIKERAGVPLVLHGGSGLRDEDFVNAIDAGVAIVHVNTELRVAYVEGLRHALADKPQEVVPFKVLAPAQEEMQKAVELRLRLFNKM